MSKGRKNALVLRTMVYFGASFTALVFLAIVGYILWKGIPNLQPSLFALRYNSENVSLFPALVNTLLMTALSLIAAVPLGMGASIYLAEYTGRGNWFVSAVRLTAETLSGIPSIIYGLFGMLFFVVTLGFGTSLLSGALTLAIMILPLIMRTTEEALLSVPDSFREGSFGLGAGRLRTVFKVVLPSAMPGVLSGVILSIGRIVGETAALIYTAGSVAELPSSLFSSVRTLSVHMYALSTEGRYLAQAYATAAVLLVIVAMINAISASLARRLGGNRNG